MEKRTFVNKFEGLFVFPAYCLGIIGLTGLAGDTASSLFQCYWALSVVAAFVTKVAKIDISCRFDFILYNIINWVLVIITKLLLPEWSFIKLLITIVSALILYKLVSTSFYFAPNPTGPYGAGFRDIVIKGETTPSVTIFYPIDIQEYQQNVENPNKTPKYVLDGEDELEGVPKLIPILRQLFDGNIVESISDNPIIRLALRDDALYQMRAIKSGTLHKDFQLGHKKQTPVIFSHGLCGRRADHHAAGVLLASYGCIVYIPNHTDGSATVYKDHNVTPPRTVHVNMYDPVTNTDSNGVKYEQDEFRRKLLNHRIKDIGVILDYIKNESIKEFKHIDLDKLAAMGQSMGGMTAIEMAKVFHNDFKICAVNDAYIRARYKDMLANEDYYISQPLLMINSEKFDYSRFVAEYDQKTIREKFFNTCMKKNGGIGYNIRIKDSGHSSSIDGTLFKPYFGELINSCGKAENVGERCQEIYHTFIAFLHKNSFLPVEFSMEKCSHIS
ncbi:unnamed protein product [Moneuplotes crassus]|uniref:1-alkyl-2-acetylglycerophosphocholine esterase n=1 Tax=Euplotes crassus TaxID=5936 RepID=A0AAD1UIF7_EUPCR|nr:unnamed protein product [Moneuplotes crassus]